MYFNIYTKVGYGGGAVKHSTAIKDSAIYKVYLADADYGGKFKVCVRYSSDLKNGTDAIFPQAFTKEEGTAKVKWLSELLFGQSFNELYPEEFI